MSDLDLDACRMCGAPEPWPATTSEQPCDLDPACEHPRHDPSSHPCGPKSQNTDDLIRQLDKVARERDSLARRCAIRFGEAETLRGEVAQLRDELERLRANQLPDGGEDNRLAIQRREIERLRADNNALRVENQHQRELLAMWANGTTNQLPDGAFIAPHDITIVRNYDTDEIVGYLYGKRPESHGAVSGVRESTDDPFVA